VESPLKGMSQNEVINEARIRLAHNKQRMRLKQLLETAANGGSVVNTRDLILACRLAKLEVGDDIVGVNDADKFVSPNFIKDRDCYGSPRAVDWRGFHQTIEYPQLHAPGTFGGPLPMTRKQKQQYKEYKDILRTKEEADAAGTEVQLKPKVDESQVRHWHKVLKDKLETRFGEIRRAFQLIDEDRSGTCDRQELSYMLNAMFNLNIPEDIMNRIIDLADYDGDGTINFAEFARIATADDVLAMKNTLTADESNFGQGTPAQVALELDRHKMAEQRRKMALGGYMDGGYHPKLRRSGPALDELRRGHKTLKKAVAARFGENGAKAAFNSIDLDGSGTLRRSELRRFLRGMVKTIPDRVISGLIDYCDNDGDGKSLSKDEFIKMVSADYLGAGGFDPNKAAKRGSIL